MPVLPKVVLSLFFFLSSTGLALANECLSKMPSGVKPAGQAKLCQSSYTGLETSYSCQDYQKGQQRYRVIYKSGLEPKAILKVTNGVEKLVYSPSWGDHKMRCPLPTPTSVPRHAKHLGIGICINNNDESIPCSVFEHAQARQTRAWRYLVFYNDNGQTELAHRMVVRDNHDAMVAEIAYQLGLSLLQTSCCSEQATAYLEYAHRLFPKATAYRSGYLDALLEQLASNEETNP